MSLSVCGLGPGRGASEVALVVRPRTCARVRGSPAGPRRQSLLRAPSSLRAPFRGDPREGRFAQLRAPVPVRRRVPISSAQASIAKGHPHTARTAHGQDRSTEHNQPHSGARGTCGTAALEHGGTLRTTHRGVARRISHRTVVRRTARASARASRALGCARRREAPFAMPCPS
jgi:hypothetical protein